ncbi:MAG: hypothetical protein WC302_03585 [Candidatus Paceibacterota bacterium]|jgi:hypothetical protein
MKKTKKDREPFWKEFAKMEAGVILAEKLAEMAEELRNAKDYDKTHFEIDGKSSLKAADKLEEFANDLKRYKNPEIEKQQNPYE